MSRLALAAFLLLATACASQRAKPSEPAVAPAPRASSPAPPSDAGAEPTVRTPAQLARDAELSRTAAAVVDVYQDRIFGFGGVLLHDGKTVVFGSDRDGSPQLYAGSVALPADPPRALTRGPERVSSAALTRDGKWILFTRDRGADENTRIYRVAVEGGDPVELTPEAGVRHDPPLLPLRSPDRMIYTTRTVTSPSSTVVVQPISGGPAHDVYVDPAPTFVADASPDGARALLVRLRSASDAVLLELDVEKGAVRRVHPPEGRTEAITAAAYGSDGRTIFVGTDQGGESSAILALDGGGAIRSRWTPQPATAAIDALLAAPRGGTLAARVNAGNRYELRLLDESTLAEKEHPRLPAGSLDLGDFTPDGATLTIAFSSPEAPFEPYAIDVRTGSASVLRKDVRANAPVPKDVVVTEVPAFDAHPIPLQAYLPKNRADRKLPVIAWFHGGPSASSEIRWSLWSEFFVKQGYAWVEPNIRGSTGFGRAWEMADNREKRGDVLKDMETVNRWIRQQPWADADRIVLFGGSYGGWIVLTGLTRQQPLWKVGVDLVGVADLRTLLKSTDQLIRAVFVDEFGDLDKDAGLLAEWSPLKDADRITAPLFVYQGANDPRVRRSESDAIVNAVRRNGRPVEYMIAADEGHSLDRRANKIEFFARVARFLEENLR